MASSERIFRLLDEPVTITEKKDAEVFEGKAEGRVDFEHVQFAYNRAHQS
ncbi:MAG: hypothetical protein R2883_07090 [Caldisericia bacterium]